MEVLHYNDCMKNNEFNFISIFGLISILGDILVYINKKLINKFNSFILLVIIFLCVIVCYLITECNNYNFDLKSLCSPSSRKDLDFVITLAIYWQLIKKKKTTT